MKVRTGLLAIILASATMSGAYAAGVTGSGTGHSTEEGCKAARASAQSQIPKDKTVTKWSRCTCQGGGANKQCTIGAEY